MVSRDPQLGNGSSQPVAATADSHEEALQDRLIDEAFPG